MFNNSWVPEILVRKMKNSLPQNFNNRRTNSFRSGQVFEPTVDSVLKSPAALFWLILHGLCCLISLVLGFRFSRLILFLFFSTSSTTNNMVTSLYSASFLDLAIRSPSLPSTTKLQEHSLPLRTPSRVIVGRHGIRIRQWPHPNPVEVMKAHRLIERVQREQRLQYGVKNPRPLIVITPTFVRTFQTLHLTGLIHTLMLVPYELTWIVVEAGGCTNETASLLAKSGLNAIHIPFEEQMALSLEDRYKTEARMRIRALRVVRDRNLDGIVLFADDSNMHSLELFDEIQTVKWAGSVSVGILAGSVGQASSSLQPGVQEDNVLPIQGPACNSSNLLTGWHIGNNASSVGNIAADSVKQLVWAGFVLNSRILWKEAEDRPQWVMDLDAVTEHGDKFLNPLSLFKDASFVEPLGKCGQKIMLWWFRTEARADSKFPSGWIIDTPLEITVPAKRTPWPDVPPILATERKNRLHEDHPQLHLRRSRRSSRSRHLSRKKHMAHAGEGYISKRSIEK